MAQNPIELERVRYWQGQLLASGDLETQLSVADEMRRLHNRAVHQAYGIAIGLEIERDETTAEIKLDADGNLVVGCGMAYDCAGRELILQANRAIPLPTEFPMTLVISRDERASDGITLRWKAPRQVNPNTEIAITTIGAATPQPESDPTLQPVIARPFARPKTATGQTIPGETTWQPWKIGDIEVGVKVLIDSSAAGFTQTPYYFAEVIAGKPTKEFIPAWFASIADPSTEGFTLQLMLRRITRESFDIADPKGMVASAPTSSPTVTLDTGGLFVVADFVSRVLPLAETAAVIKGVSGQTVSLETPISKFTDPKLIALGNIRRETVVKKLSNSAAFFEVTVEDASLFDKGEVVAKLSDPIDTSRPSRIVSIDDSGTLELLPVIADLAKGATLGAIRTASSVKTISTSQTEVTVDNPSLYTKGDMVARLADPIDNSSPVKIEEKKSDGTLVLSKAITGLTVGDSLGVAAPGSTVIEVNNNANEIKIEVESVAPFKKGDLLARSNANGSFSAPVRIERIFTGTKTITLSGSILDLAIGDTLVAANFSARATVLKLDSSKTVRVNDATLFPADSYVARVDKLLTASKPAHVNNASGQLLTLDSEIDKLQSDEVIALCSFPASVTVNAVFGDGRIEVSAPGLLHEGDLITPLPDKPGLSLITKTSGNVIHLATKLKDLAAGDRLSVASIRGALKANDSENTKVEVEQPERLRVGDFLADITGWRQVQNEAIVSKVTDTQLTLLASLDGALLNDVVGLASINPATGFFGIASLLQLRLNQSLELKFDEDVLVIGFDRLTGVTHTVFGNVQLPLPDDRKIVFLKLRDPEKFTLRPEDISASVLFVKGSALALIQENDLFVSWLAVGDPEQMPRRCDGTDEADCECASAKE